MAKVEWSPGIEHVSGALAKPGSNPQHSCTHMLLGTHRRAATTSDACNRLYMRKKVHRSTYPSVDEIDARARFAAVAIAVNNRRKNLSLITTDQQNFLAQRNTPGGCRTMRKYYWKICGQEYDAQHPRD